MNILVSEFSGLNFDNRIFTRYNPTNRGGSHSKEVAIDITKIPIKIGTIISKPHIPLEYNATVLTYWGVL